MATSRSNSAMPHDPGFQPSSYRSQSSGPGELWPPTWFCADFFPPFLLMQRERLCR